MFRLAAAATRSLLPSTTRPAPLLLRNIDFRNNSYTPVSLSSILVGKRWMSSTNESKQAKGLFDALEDDSVEDENLLPFEVTKAVRLGTDKLVNTRGRFREQICRTPMMQTGVKKLNHLAHLIKGLDIEEAILQLMFCKRDDAVEVIWALQEGARIANQIQDMDPKNLFVAYAYLCRGSYVKKLDIKGRGRTGRIRSPETYMVIMLREKAARVLTLRPKPREIRVPFPHPRSPINSPKIKV